MDTVPAVDSRCALSCLHTAKFMGKPAELAPTSPLPTTTTTPDSRVSAGSDLLVKSQLKMTRGYFSKRGCRI